jgi:hypothetical protein
MNNVRQRIENNLILVVLAVAIAVAGPTAGVVRYLSDQQHNLELTGIRNDLNARMNAIQAENERLKSEHQREMAKLESELSAKLDAVSREKDALQTEYKEKVASIENRLSSIERGVGKEGLLDVRSFLKEENEAFQVPVSARYLPEDEFYASQDDTHWTYSLTTEKDLLQQLTDVNIPEGTSMHTISTLVPVHLWRAKEALPVSMGSNGFSHIFPYIAVQRISYDKLEELLKMSIGLDASLQSDSAKSADEAIPTDTPDYLKELSQTFRGDAVGPLFALQLWLGIQAALSPDVEYELVKAQKVGPVVYAQSLITLKDARVDNKLYPEYYLRTEVFMVSTENGVYFVRTLVPSSERLPRDEYFKWTTSWFSDLVIPIRKHG